MAINSFSRPAVPEKPWRKQLNGQEQNLEFDAVNDNLPEIIEFYGHNSRKISCDYYIDNRMLLPEGAKA